MKSYVVIGLGRFGTSIAMALSDLGHEVMAIDDSEERVQSISEYVTHAIVGDCKEESVLRSVGIRNFDVVIVAIGTDLEASVLVTLNLIEMGAKYVLAKAQSEMHAKLLNKIGAHRVVFPERDMGIRVAQSLSTTNILDVIELSPDYSIMEINVPAKWVGKSIIDLDVRTKYGINIMAIKLDDVINVSPDPLEILSARSVLVIIGQNEDLKKLV